MIKQKNIKKILLFILFSLIFFLTSNLVNASSTTWDFTSSSDYTYSSSTAFTVSGTIASLRQNTLIHNGSITNATTYNGAYDVVVDGNYAYMTSFLGDRVNVLDISNPASPTLVGSVLDGGTVSLNGASGIIKDGNYLYVASNVSDAIQVIDVTTPTSPTAVGRLVNATTLNGARGIAKSGNYLFVANDARDSVAVINVTTPTSPTYVTEIRNATTLNGARDIKISGNYAYVSAYDGDRFTVVNITTPTSPTIVANINDGTNLNGAWGLEISGNYAYVSAYLNSSVRVINITTPTSPTAVTNISGGSYSLANPRDLLISDNLLYISSFGSDAVNVADISTPTSPTYLTKILYSASNPLINGAYGLYKVGDYIYVAAYDNDALEILKLNYDTTSPYLIPTTSFNYGILNTITSFSQTLGSGNAGTITYQISKDNGTTRYYLNGTTWTSTTGGVANSSSASSINSYLSTFNALSGGTGQFTFKAFFTSNGDQIVELDNVTVIATDPQSPGGVSSNISLWLKANKGTNSITDGASITSWNDWSGNGYNATTGVAPVYVNNDINNLNYNPLISFDGTTYLENLNNGSNSISYFMVIVPTNQIDGTITGQVPFGFDCNSGVLNTGTCGLTFAGGVLGAFTIAMNDEVITHAIGASTGRRSAQIGAYSYTSGNPMLIGFNQNSSGNGTDIYEKGLKIDNYIANTYQTLSTADYRIGRSSDTVNIFPYNGKIAEIINYSSRVSDTDIQKIESYLAIKYGITLNSGVNNYIASDGTTSIWNSTSAGTYTYNIFGIGRDDLSGLGQVLSKSSNPSGILTIQAIGEGTNMSNNFSDISNNEFLSISNDNGSNTWIQTGNPNGYDILSGKWKVQETGDVGTLNLDFDVGNSNFDIPLYNSGSSYYFVYDSDNDSLLSDETPIVMTNFSGNIWRASGINLSNGQIFTLAGVTSSNSIPTNITLSNNTINENIASGSTIGTLSTTDADSGDIHTYSFISGLGDTDNSTFNISCNTLYINESPDYEIKNTYYIRIQTNDGNGGLFQKAFTININNLGETINSIIDFETTGKYTVTSGIWSRVTTNPYEGSYSIQSNNGGVANTQSCFEVSNTFYSGTGTINFHYYVSSQASSDYLRFYIDNVEQQSWSGTIPWTTYTNVNIPSGSHSYKWCYIKDTSGSSGTDNAYVDYITFENGSIDLTPPSITSINYASGTLLPGGNHNLIINYNDIDTGIDITSDIIALYKWNGTAWGSDISSTGLNLSGKTVTTTSATYPTNNLTYGKYYYTFQISDNYGNSSSTGAVFYIDEPKITVNTGTLDLGNLTGTGLNFSGDEIIITIETVGAGFQLQLSKDTSFSTSSGSIIIDWDGSKGIGYDQSPYTLINKNINDNQTLANQIQNINTNGNKNIYTYNIKIGTLIDLEQEAGDYQMNMSFLGIFSY